MTDANPVNGTDSVVQVALPGGKSEQFEKAVAEVKDGHLVVRNNILYNNTKVVAIYAPGAWLSASLPVSARQ